MPTFKITITDEFNQNYVFETNNSKNVIKIVNDWLSHYDETPIYSIFIDIQPN